MAKPQEGTVPTHSDGVMVLSVWQQGGEGFLGRFYGHHTGRNVNRAGGGESRRTTPRSPGMARPAQ